VLQCVAVCCSVLQCVAVCCSVLQCVAVCCSVLQCASAKALVNTSELQCVAMCCSVLYLLPCLLECSVPNEERRTLMYVPIMYVNMYTYTPWCVCTFVWCVCMYVWCLYVYTFDVYFYVWRVCICLMYIYMYDVYIYMYGAYMCTYIERWCIYVYIYIEWCVPPEGGPKSRSHSKMCGSSIHIIFDAYFFICKMCMYPAWCIRIYI